jgi:hypothetical protein
MRTRRDVLFALGAGGLWLACTGDEPAPDPEATDGAAAPGPDGSVAPGGDAAVTPVDAPGCTMTVTLHDTYAMALYFDGGLGPRTGIIRVSAVAAGVDLPMEFWHGHGGQQHRFTVTAAHFAALRRRERVMVETTEVDAHRHLLFIDPVDPRWRVEGAAPQTIPAC